MLYCAFMYSVIQFFLRNQLIIFEQRKNSIQIFWHAVLEKI